MLNIQHKNRKLPRLCALSLSIGLIASCQTVDNEKSALSASKKVTIEQLALVDCLLPGQVKQLGTKMTYLTPRRPARLTASECSIRGGEYTAYDRSNLTSSLNVWMPLAQEGDAKAQNYLGQIYENGVNGKPDFQLAALWYKRSAKQGNKSAKVNLGFLYESGLGVKKDSVKALNLYREAADLKDDNLDYTSTIEKKIKEGIEDWQEKYRQNLKQTQAKSHEIKKLRKQLKTYLAQPQNLELTSSDKLTKHLKEQRQQLLSLRQSARSNRNALQLQLNGMSQENTSIKKLLEAKNAEIKTLNSKLSSIDKQYSRKKSSLIQSSQENTELRSDYNRLLSQYSSKTLSLKEAENELTNYRSQLTFYQESIDKLNEKLNNKASTQLRQEKLHKVSLDALKLELTQTQSLIEQQEIEKARLAKDNEYLKSQISKLKLSAEKLVIDQKIANLTKQHNELIKVNQSKLQLTAKLNGLNQTQQKESVNAPVNKGLVKDLGFGNFHALIVGNDNYQFLPNLNTAVSDAKAVEEMLRTEYGYQTTLLLNTNRDTMLTEIFKLQQRLDKNSNLLIYYAGHGEIKDSRGYWLLSNAAAQNNYNWVPTQQVTDLISQFDARKIIIIADSCYSGILTRRSVLSPGIKIDINNDKYSRWLKAMAKGKSRTVLTSGGLQPVLDGGGGQHSIFAKHFIAALKANRSVLDAHTLFNQIFPEVKEEAVTLNVEQSPQYAPIKNANHYSVDYFFIKQG